MAEDAVVDQKSAETEPVEPSVTLEAPETEAAPAPNPEETRARELGWVPQEEFQGRPERWKPASDFLAFQEARPTSLKQENLRLQAQLGEMRAQIEALTKAEAERQAAGERLKIDGLKFERKQALDNGDNERLTQIDDELIAARANEAVQKVTQVKTAQQQQAEYGQRLWNEFVADGNDWANNEQMGKLMLREVMVIKSADPSLQPLDVLNEAKDRLQRLYPEKFDRKQRAPQPSGMVDMGGLNGSGRALTKTWNDLNPDARQTFERMIDGDPILRKDPKAAMANILKNCVNEPQLYFRR